MGNREKKIDIKKHSIAKVSRENLWFFSEDSVLSESSVPEKKSGKKGDSLRMIYENYDPFMLKPSERTKLKKECNFVVDWQLSDSL